MGAWGSAWGVVTTLLGAAGAVLPKSSTEKRFTVYTSGILCRKFRKFGAKNPKSRNETCTVMVKKRDFCHCLSGSLDVGKGKGTVSVLSFWLVYFRLGYHTKFIKADSLDVRHEGNYQSVWHFFVGPEQDRIIVALFGKSR